MGVARNAQGAGAGNASGKDEAAELNLSPDWLAEFEPTIVSAALFSPAIYGFGGGVFFLGYSVFQIPANLILEKIGARRWIFLILLIWGAVSASNARNF